MYLHKDIIIVLSFLSFGFLIISILFYKDVNKILNDLRTFSGKPIKSSKYFFFRFFEPIIFRINNIVSEQQFMFKTARLRVYFYDYFFKHFPDPLLIIDTNQNIVDYNISCETLIGENALNKNIFSVLRIPELGELIKDSVKKKRPIESEVNLIYPKEKFYRIWISGRRSVGDNSLNFIRLYDSTVENNFQDMQREFIANASHELKTPISSIMGYCETLIQDNKLDSKKRKGFLNTVMSESQRMSLLVQDLLSLQKIERLEHSPLEEHVNLIEILDEVSSIISRRKFPNKIKYVFEIPKKKISIYGDQSGLEQVFVNIIENAIIHSNSKKPIIIKLTESSSQVIFSVQDFGIGIPNQHLPFLTKRFFRVDAARSRDSGNTGLGLSIVKHTLNRHNAELQIFSEEGKGSTFEITFPKKRIGLLQ